MSALKCISATPLSLALTGWLLFVLMYGLVGISSLVFGFEVTPSFLWLSPLGLAACVCWCSSVLKGVKLIKNRVTPAVILGVLVSLLSLGALGYVLWLLFHGF